MAPPCSSLLAVAAALHAHACSGLVLDSAATLWEGGTVRYLVDTAASDAASAATLLAADDARIAAAVELWARGTCLTFSACDPADEPSCVRPYVKFISTGGACRADAVGAAANVNSVYVSTGCTTEGLAHEVGHVLGFANTHERADAARFVTVDRTALAAGARFDVLADAAAGRDLGPYDYESVMHLPSDAYALDGQTTITAPVAISQRTSLSASDAAAVAVAYQACRSPTDPPSAPTCAASLQATGTLIPSDQATVVHFVARHSATMGVATGTNPASIVFDVADGSTGVASLTKIGATITPSAGDVGQSLTVAVEFSDEGMSALSVTCSVVVEVAAGAVCYGAASGDAAVCSGHGTCQSAVPHCDCEAGWEGITCATETSSGGLGFWDQGEVRYLVSTGLTDTEAAADFLEAGDTAIASALKLWSDRTCLTFVACDAAAPETCAKPYLQFVSTAGECRSSTFARRGNDVTVVYVSGACKLPIRNLVQKVGHALGMAHAHERTDKAEYVTINTGAIAEGKAQYFNVDAENRIGLGAYDYGSIMHLPSNAYAAGAAETIVSPVTIGSGSRITDADVAAVHFKYNTCQGDVYAAPICIASRNMAAATVIPTGVEWVVGFTVKYSKDVTATFTGSLPTTPSDDAVLTAGAARGDQVAVSVTPTAAGAVSVTATFTDPDDSAKTVTCTVRATATTQAVCFEQQGDAACSGKGSCSETGCNCDPGRKGSACQAVDESGTPPDDGVDDDDGLEWYWIFAICCGGVALSIAAAAFLLPKGAAAPSAANYVEMLSRRDKAAEGPLMDVYSDAPALPPAEDGTDLQRLASSAPVSSPDVPPQSLGTYGGPAPAFGTVSPGAAPNFAAPVDVPCYDAGPPPPWSGAGGPGSPSFR
eukprot:TRINITY_DN13589_c0_g1_i1.p1 TRINITY_DN13589_c0_g1~~TRINITY_DN13589_c0_g1_i1.p1  ORF type:complete len:897 (+),score=130.69 TRINITY_DN13589_c0_g1_i1:39-2693(+)